MTTTPETPSTPQTSRVGEVWKMNDSVGTTVVILGKTENSTFYVLGRNLQTIVVSEGSFGNASTWTLVQKPVKNPCTHPSCTNQVVAKGLGGKYWCFQHIPRNQPVYLPNTPDDCSTPLEIFAECPICGTPKDELTHTLCEGLSVYTCICRGIFIPLILPSGTPINGGISRETLIKDTKDAFNILDHEKCLKVSVISCSNYTGGFTSLVRELAAKRKYTFSGVLSKTAKVFNNFIILQGVPFIEPSQKVILQQKVELNSCWVSKKGKDSYIYRLVSMGGQEHVAWRGDDSDDPVTILGDLRRSYRRVPTTQQNFHCALNTNSSPLKEVPKEGGLYLDRNLSGYSKVVEVFSCGDFTQVSWIEAKCPGAKMSLLEYFQYAHSQNDEHKYWEIGKEYYFGSKGQFSGILKSYDTVNITLENPDAYISVRDFLGATKIVRVDPLDIILSDD